MVQNCAVNNTIQYTVQRSTEFSEGSTVLQCELHCSIGRGWDLGDIGRLGEGEEGGGSVLAPQNDFEHQATLLYFSIHINTVHGIAL